MLLPRVVAQKVATLADVPCVKAANLLNVREFLRRGRSEMREFGWIPGPCGLLEEVQQGGGLRKLRVYKAGSCTKLQPFIASLEVEVPTEGENGGQHDRGGGH